MSYKYQNGKWTYVPSSVTSNNNNSGNSDGGGGSSNFSPPISPSIPPPQEIPKYNDEKKSTHTSKGDSRGGSNHGHRGAEKKYKEIEKTILSGDVKVDPIPMIKATDTVRLTGLGRNLTGRYFVDKVVHTIDSNGYTQTLTVSREGFGENIKKGNVSKPDTHNSVGSNNDGYETINKWGKVTAKIGLNVRNAPGTSNSIKGAMPYNHRVYVYGKKNG